MTTSDRSGLRCSGLALEVASQLELFERIAPGSESGVGQGAFALHDLADQMQDLGLSRAADLLAGARDEFARIIDHQFRCRGGIQDWSQSWISMAILGAVNDPKPTVERIESLLGWRIHEQLLQVDLVFHPIARSSPLQCIAELRTQSPVRILADQYARFRDELEPLGVVAIYDRGVGQLCIERPARFKPPQDSEGRSVLDRGISPRLRLLIELGLVERVEIGYPTPMRPRTAVERHLLRLVVPSSPSRVGGAMRLSDLANLLDLPIQRLRCHVQQVGHSQEWGGLLLEYFAMLLGTYRGIGAAGGWDPELHATVLSRHVSLDKRLRFDTSRLIDSHPRSTLDEEAISAFFQVQGESLVPHGPLLQDAGTSSELLARIGSDRAVGAIVRGAGDRLVSLARSLDELVSGIPQPPPNPVWQPVPPAPLQPRPLSSSLGFVRLADAQANWNHAQAAHAALSAEYARQSAHIAALEGAMAHHWESASSWARAKAASHAAVTVRCLGLALQSAAQLGAQVAAIQRFRDRLLLGTLAGVSETPCTVDTDADRDTLQMAESLLRHGATGCSVESRADALAAVLYYLIHFDQSPDHAELADDSATGGFAMADDVEILLSAAERAQVVGDEFRERVQSRLDAAFAERAVDSEARARARLAVQRLRDRLMGTASPVADA
jgi:hypothetical protein